jgi:glycosyltransferase involved in cell wall biosynthesis
VTRPAITVLIPTYARTSLLEEALESALRQEYPGPVSILVVNDCPWQQLRLADQSYARQIRILNLSYPMTSLGEKRYLMLQAVDAPFVSWLDDDDLIMPWYLNGLDETKAVTLPSHWFRFVQDRWSWGPMPGGMPMIVNRAAALTAGFEPLNTGEDNAHRAKLIAAGDVARDLGPPGYCYRTPGTYLHISRSYTPGDPLRSISGEAYRADAEARMRAGVEPTGDVMIRPRWREDYWSTLAKLFPKDIPAPR